VIDVSADLTSHFSNLPKTMPQIGIVFKKRYINPMVWWRPLWAAIFGKKDRRPYREFIDSEQRFFRMAQ
jgi:hypothetical protein